MANGSVHLRLPLRQKILFLVLSTSVLIYVVSMSYVVTIDRRAMLTDAYQKVRLNAKNSASRVSLRLERYMALMDGLAKSFEGYYNLPASDWQLQYLETMVRTYVEHRELASLWDSWEYAAILPDYGKPYGRLSRMVYAEADGSVRIEESELSMMGDPLVYGNFKAFNRPGFWEPYEDITSDVQHGVLMTTVAVPIRREGSYVGLVACDVTLDWLQRLVQAVKPFHESSAFLFSSTGLIAAHSADSLLMRPVDALFPDEAQRESLSESIQLGKELSFIHVDEAGRRHYVYLTPVVVEQAFSKWSMGISVPLDIITATADRSVALAIGALIVGLALLVVLLVLIANSITRPVRAVTAALDRLQEGDLSYESDFNVSSGDELEVMSHALEGVIAGLNAKNEVARRIGEGQLDNEVPLLSERDTLGQSLRVMQENLRQAAREEAARQEASAQRAWANQGITQFSEIIRTHTENLDELCEALTQRLVRFVDANQGALYLLADSENEGLDARPSYVLQTAFAWDRKRYVEATIPLGVGLVGSCAMERQLLFITDIPSDYCLIPAGVGDVLPRCLVFVPFIHENRVLGVMELAAFEVFQPHVLEFLERLAPTIAASLFSVKVGSQTRLLLQHTQEQAEELGAQEEELRQNLEEIQATQEESVRRQQEMEEYVNSLKRALYYTEYDLDGRIIAVSDQYILRTGLNRNALMGTLFSDHLAVEGWTSEDYERFWGKVIAGNGQRLESQLAVRDGEARFSEFYVPIQDSEGGVVKVVKLSYEV